MKLRALLLAALLVVSGCAHSSGGIAPSTIPLESGGYDVLAATSGNDCAWYLFGLIPVSGGNTTREAVSAALRRRPGATALINVTSDTFSQNFVVVARTCTEVYGIAVRVRPASDG